MSFNIGIPRSVSTSDDIALNHGDILFVLGANGSGKSSLMQSIYTSHGANALRISAHRQTWFHQGYANITSVGRREAEKTIRNGDSSHQARWTESYPEHRTNVAIYDLINAENIRAREIAAAVDRGDNVQAQILSERESTIKIINGIFRLSNLPIEISISEDEEIVATKSGGKTYSVAKMSDGERNALLIAGNVLTADPGKLLIIDEPERHLHRSIISPLLSLLFARRPDCAFIISTHDTLLPLDHPGAKILLARECKYVDDAPASWEVDIIDSCDGIDDETKREILGSRKKVLFVEGNQSSLDKPLYSILFPNVSVIPKSSCRDVEDAVSGIRDAEGLHWVHAFGIVDNDRRPAEDIATLKTKGVYALPVFSVESIYYHPDIQKRVAERHAKLTGEDSACLLADAKESALRVVRLRIEHLIGRIAERRVREKIFKSLPKRDQITAAQSISIEIDVAAEITAERRSLESAIESQDLSAIINKYPIRETGALNEIAKKLGFQDRSQYESTVRKLLMDDEETLAYVKSLFGTLAADLDAA